MLVYIRTLYAETQLWSQNSELHEALNELKSTSATSARRAYELQNEVQTIYSSVYI